MMHGTRTGRIKKLPSALLPVCLRRSVIDEHSVELNAFGKISRNHQRSLLKNERLLRNLLKLFAALGS
ncbi:hypothetical protein D3C73_1623460 [compost metagenome]